MDFKVDKPSHIFALLLLIFSILLVFILPVATFIIMLDHPLSLEDIDIPELTAVLNQFIVIATFILVPIAWYFIVNKLSFKGTLSRMKLVSENIDKAFLWGILAAILIFLTTFVIEIILISSFGYSPGDLSNIPYLEKLFSPATMFFIVGIQPVAEEIFFRGFLYEKVENFAGGAMAIIITSILFGIAHLSYGLTIPVLIIILMGMILGYVVYRTKNLYSAIIAHVVYNVTSLALAYLAQHLTSGLALIL
jgi:membrane protease YdiL (CAAX protease family)